MASSGAPPSLGALARALPAALGLDPAARAALPPDDPAGVWLATRRPVARLALRLDAGPPPYRWARGADAVLLHRPWGLWPARLPDGVGAVAVHAALDAWLWTAADAGLARALGVRPEGAPLQRDGRALGTEGPAPADALDRLRAACGPPAAVVGDAARPVRRVAVLGAMTDALVREAAARGATHVVTGQIRAPGVAAAEATGVAVIATGQAAAEAWGLRAVGAALAARYPGLTVLDRTAFGRAGTGRAGAGGGRAAGEGR